MKTALVSLALVIALAGCQVSDTPIPSVSENVTPTLTGATPIPLTPIWVDRPTLTVSPSPSPTLYITPPATGQPAIVPILMYHNLADLDNNASELERTWTVSPKSFQDQIEMIVSRGFRTVTMADLADHLRRGKPLVSKPIVITFDDGWGTGYSVAFPILKRYNLVGTFYVYTNAIDQGKFLKWKEIDEMARGGMEFGSHSLSHAHLRDISQDSARREIVESKAILEKRLGRAITTFDYPFGEYDARIVDLVKSAGFESAVTIASGYKHRAEDLSILHRIRVSYADRVQDLSGLLP